jgi:hypothetical protein
VRKATIGLVVAALLCAARTAFADPTGSFGNAVHLAPTPLAPLSIPTHAITTSSSVALAASASRWRLSYQVQGSGYACLSWVTATITISANAASATCTGNGAFLVTAMSTSQSVYPATNSTALNVIGAPGASLQIVFDGN